MIRLASILLVIGAVALIGTSTSAEAQRKRRATKPRVTQTRAVAAMVRPIAAATAFRSCAAAREAGRTPIRQGEPGYGYHLDRDRDGIACE